MTEEPLFLCPKCEEWRPKRKHCGPDSPTCTWVSCPLCRIAIRGDGRYIPTG